MSYSCSDGKEIYRTKKRDARAESFCLPYSTYCYFDVAFPVAVAVVGLKVFPRSFLVVLGGDFR